MQFRDTATGETLNKGMRVGGDRLAAALSPEGKLLAICHAWWKVNVWDVGSGQQLQVLNCNERAYAVTFSPDGRVLATGLRDGTVVLWDVATGEKFGSSLQHQAPLLAAAFSPDGNLLATASGKKASDVSLRIWDISASPPYHSLALPLNQTVRGNIALSSFSSDGTILVEKSNDGSAHLWSLPPVPVNLYEIRLRTWIALGSRLNAQGGITAIPWEQYGKLRDELRDLSGKAE